MKEIQKNSLVLVLIAAISVTFLAFIKEYTKKDYIKTMKAEENKVRAQIFPDADSFKKIMINNKEAFLAVKSGAKIGIIVKGIGKGFGGDVVIALGVNLAGQDKNKIRGFQLLKHNETPGLGTKAKEPVFMNAFKNKNMKTLPESKSDFKAKLGIDTIAGATITSIAVLNAVKNALDLVKKYNGKNSSSGSTNATKEKSGDTNSGATRVDRQSYNTSLKGGQRES